MSYSWLEKICVQIHSAMIEKEKYNKVGCAVILYGMADTCKSTITRIIGKLEDPYQIWVGSQWIGQDNLRWDTVTKTKSKTLITEEMIWQHIQRKHTIDDSLTMIKEQLTGAGANNRSNKSGKLTVYDEQTNLKFMLFSMNNTNVKGKLIQDIVEYYPEYKKRILCINMDPYAKFIQENIEQTRDLWSIKEEDNIVFRLKNTFYYNQIFNEKYNKVPKII